MLFESVDWFEESQIRDKSENKMIYFKRQLICDESLIQITIITSELYNVKH